MPRNPRILVHVLIAGILSTGVAHAEIQRFAEVSPGIFRGSKPTTQADFDFLKARGVRTILSIQTLPWDSFTERRDARQHEIEYRNIHIYFWTSPGSRREARKRSPLNPDRSITSSDLRSLQARTRPHQHDRGPVSRVLPELDPRSRLGRNAACRLQNRLDPSWTQDVLLDAHSKARLGDPPSPSSRKGAAMKTTRAIREAGPETREA